MTKAPNASLNASATRSAIVEALMRLAAERNWEDFSIADIASEAGVSLIEFRNLFPSKGAVLASFSRQIDDKVLAEPVEFAEDAAKDRLFDVLMRRLDAMRPYRAALKSILQWAKRTPSAALALNQMAVNSQRFMLEAAGISSEGPVGALKVQGLALGFVRILEIWVDDESEDLGPTMAALDKLLERGGQMVARAEDAQRLSAPLFTFIGGLAKLASTRGRGDGQAHSRGFAEPGI